MIDLQGKMIVLHGPPKVGKTQLAASFPKKILFIATEQGHSYLPEGCKVISLPPGKKGWDKYKALLDALPLWSTKPKTIVIDVATQHYLNCLEWVCKKERFDHPQDPPMGKGWHAVRLEFVRWTSELAHICSVHKITFLVLDHSRTEEIQTATGTYSKISCSMAGQARNVLLTAPDFIWYMGYDSPITGDTSIDVLKDFSGGRCLYIDGNHAVEAGNRDPAVTIQVITNLPKTNQFDFITEALNNSAVTQSV